MKLHIVPARQGMLWARMGMRTFFQQPLALSGLFFLLMVLLSVLSMVPVVGNGLGLMLLPGMTLALMAATRQALRGQFSLPQMLSAGVRAGRAQVRALLVLGVLYAAGFMLILGASAWVDGGKFARFFLVGGALNIEVLMAPDFQFAAQLSMVLQMLLSLLFWHAPALVYWHGVAPVKSLFFSIVACVRNFWAFTVFGLMWVGLLIGIGLGSVIVGALTGSAQWGTVLMIPAIMLLAAMFSTSLYFSFQDCFGEASEAPSPASTPSA